MLLELRIKNFKSIEGEQIFTMLSEKGVKEHSDTVSDVKGINILRSAVIYGRNASGKSNMLKAIYALQYLVWKSADFKVDAPIAPYEPFRLSKESSNKPVEFRLDFIAKDGIRYIYEIAFSRFEIEKENLYFFPKAQIAKLFERSKGNPISYGEYMTGRKKDIEQSLYQNQLFLSKVGSDRIDQLTHPYLFINDSIFCSLSHDTNTEQNLTAIYSNRMAREHRPYFNENMGMLLRASDTGIESLSVKEIPVDSKALPADMSYDEKQNVIEKYSYQIRTHRKVYDGDKEIGNAEFRLRDESTGTNKLIVVGGLILEALADGQTIVIDELDKSLHPKLTRALIAVFNNSKTNPNNAQLIFATHDVSLLDIDLFRRDQIWIAEKDYKGSSSYYCLSDISGVRKDTPLEKWYMDGRFGGIPSINDFELNFKF